MLKNLRKKYLQSSNKNITETDPISRILVFLIMGQSVHHQASCKQMEFISLKGPKRF